MALSFGRCTKLSPSALALGTFEQVENQGYCKRRETTCKEKDIRIGVHVCRWRFSELHRELMALVSFFKELFAEQGLRASA
jgi:hypothetical protein